MHLQTVHLIRHKYTAFNAQQDLNRHFSKADTELSSGYMKKCSTLTSSRKLKWKLPWETIPQLLEWLWIEWPNVTSVCKWWRKDNYTTNSNIVIANQENDVEISLFFKIDLYYPLSQQIPLLYTYPKEMKPPHTKDMWAPMATALLPKPKHGISLSTH